MFHKPVFSGQIDFPSSDKKEFSVLSIEAGYQFIFYTENGEDDGNFSIDAKKVESLQAAIGYEGKEADAIQVFRAYGKDKWPERFHF